jgi:hypothetical protein
MTGRCPNSLAHLLSTDKQASLTAAGAVVFGCHLHEHDLPARKAGVLGLNPVIEAAESAAEDAAAAAAAAAKADVSLAFKLHSRPSSPKKIFLEFRGCVTEVRPAASLYHPDACDVCCLDSSMQAHQPEWQRKQQRAVWQGGSTESTAMCLMST